MDLLFPMLELIKESNGVPALTFASVSKRKRFVNIYVIKYFTYVLSAGG